MQVFVFLWSDALMYSWFTSFSRKDYSGKVGPWAGECQSVRISFCLIVFLKWRSNKFCPKSAIQTRSPSKAARMFSGTQDKCATCGKTAYPLEKVILVTLCLFPFHYFLSKFWDVACENLASNSVVHQGQYLLWNMSGSIPMGFNGFHNWTNICPLLVMLTRSCCQPKFCFI